MVAVVTLLALSLLSSKLVSDYYYSWTAAQLKSRGEEIASFLSSGGLVPDRRWFEMLDRFANARLMVVDVEGQILATSSPRAPIGTRVAPGEVVMPPQRSPGTPDEVSRRFGEPMLSVTVPIVRGSTTIGNLVLSSPVQGVNMAIDAVRYLILYAAAGSIVLSTIVAYTAARSIARPVNEISDVALRMVEGDLQQQIPVKSGDEIGQLATNLNRMASALDQTIKALGSEKAKIENVLANMSEGVIATDLEGKVILINRRAREVLGTGDSLVPDVYQGAGGEALRDLVTEVTGTGVASAMEFQVGTRYLVAHASPMGSSEGAPGPVAGIVIVLQDATRLMESEELRTQLLANVAHELRTPLTSISAYAQALQDDLARDETMRQKFVTTIQKESARLNRLVTDLLDLSIMQAGKAEWPVAAINVADLISRVVDRYRTSGRAIVVDTDEGLPLASGNEARLEQVLGNLLDNAAKYSPPEAPLAVRARATGSHVVVSVADRGPGIPDADLPHIWERFYRVDKSRSRSEGGAGLGLAIVKEVVEAHGGTVGVDSQDGHGSVFWFTVPLAERT
jgi:two-component system sensor histidine kinase ResE